MKSKSLSIILSLLAMFFFNEVLGQDKEPAFQCGVKMTDIRDGKTYITVNIGTQCWMAENLNVGPKISLVKDQRNNGIIEKYCYDNAEENCKIYGGLYQWNEMMQYTTTPGIQGICPAGWHLPTDEEWCTLTIYLDTTVNCDSLEISGTTAGGKMKSTGTIEAATGLWYAPDAGATNESGFNALPGGTRSIYTKFLFKGYHAYFWSSTEYNASDAWFSYLKYSNTNVYREHYFKASSYSVRCLKDE